MSKCDIRDIGMMAPLDLDAGIKGQIETVKDLQAMVSYWFFHISKP